MFEQQKSSRKELVNRFTDTMRIANSSMLQSHEKDKSASKRSYQPNSTFYQGSSEYLRKKVPILPKKRNTLMKRMSMPSIQKEKPNQPTDEAILPNISQKKR